MLTKTYVNYEGKNYVEIWLNFEEIVVWNYQESFEKTSCKDFENFKAILEKF